MEVRKELLPAEKRQAKPSDENALGFGQIFTDHMLKIDYHAGQGWHDPRIVPYGPLELDPAALVLHYGQEVFEGLKAYWGSTAISTSFAPRPTWSAC